jgi:hypothetical protein
MAKHPAESPTLRSRKAVKALDISLRILWGLVSPRLLIPYLRPRDHKPQTVLNLVFKLRISLSRQASGGTNGRSSAKG